MILCLKTLRQAARVSLCLLSPFTFAATQPVFPVLTYEPYAVSSPLAMADGDINGDGITDTLYASASGTQGSTTLTAALRSVNAGTAPTLAATTTISCTANSIVLADLNKDSRLDAVVTCNEGTVAVLGGKGDGTFSAATTYAVANAAKAIAADLNADGYPDLAVAMNSGNNTSTLAVLLNTGTGPIAFSSPTVYGGITGSAYLLIGDLNNDGKPDVIAGLRPGIFQAGAGGTFYGNGDGTFKPEIYVSGMYNNVALADFDGDGHTDIAAVNNSNSSIAFGTSVLVTYGNNARIGQQIDTPLPVVSIQPADINGDGHPDLVLVGSTTTVLINDGLGSLTIMHSYATPGSFYTSRKGAGGLDFVFTTPRGFYTLHGDGKGNFDGIPNYFLSDTGTSADINKDGLTDLVTYRPGVGPAYTVVARGDGSFAQYRSTFGWGGSLPTIADGDGDGLLDLIAFTTPGQTALMWSKGSPDGTFTPKPPSMNLNITGVTSAVPADFNQDGKLDVALSYLDTTTNTSGLMIFPGNGDGAVVTPGILVASSNAVQAKALAADLNQDGKLDLLWNGNAYINKGNTQFTALALPAQGTPLAAADLNGDNIADVIIDNAIYAGKGDGTFLASPILTIPLPVNATPLSASAGDLNGDGNPDLVLQCSSDMALLIVVFGDGHGNFTVDSNPYTFGLKSPISGAFARLNNSAPKLPGDNRLDYVAFVDGAAIALINQTNLAPGPPVGVATTTTFFFDSAATVPLKPVTAFVQVAGANPTGAVTLTTPDGTVLAKSTLASYQNYTNFSATFPAPGTYSVTASYSGDSVNAPSVSSPVTISVAKMASTTYMNIKPSGYYTGRTSTFDAFVDGYNPTGQITFYSGPTILGTASGSVGQAHIGYKFGSAGTYQVSTSYSGDDSNLPSVSSNYTINVVDGPDFSISAAPGTNTVKAGETATYTISVASLRNYSGYVTMSCAPSCNTTQLFVAPGQPSTIQFSVTPTGSGTPAGPYLRLAPIAAALLLFGIRRSGKHSMPRLYPGLLIVCFSLGLLSVTGCSSSKDSSSSGSSSGTPYTIMITATDPGIEASHSVSLTLIVK
jgi:hypothetical protein